MIGRTGRFLGGMIWFTLAIGWWMFVNIFPEINLMKIENAYNRCKDSVINAKNGLLAHIWRFLVALTDWRTWLRYLSCRPIVDVVFITNMRDEVDRKRFLGNWNPSEGHFNGPRYWFRGSVAGRTRAINTVTEELGTPAGRGKAQTQFIAAVKWAEQNGARVILLAAGTKRLFGPQANSLKALFPRMLFTIGDNGTTHLLRSETIRALEESASTLVTRVCVIGPTGLLGKSMVRHLIEKGYQVVGLCGKPEHVASVKRVYGCSQILTSGFRHHAASASRSHRSSWF